MGMGCVPKCVCVCEELTDNIRRPKDKKTLRVRRGYYQKFLLIVVKFPVRAKKALC